MEYDRLTEMFAAIDQQDSPKFGSFLAPDCVLQFANIPPVVGRENVQEFVSGFFSSLTQLRHEVVKSWNLGAEVICHGWVSYTRNDRSVLRVPFCNILNTSDQGIREYKIYVDNSALYS